MNYLEQRIKEILEKQNKTMKWLANEIDYSRQGLKNGLSNKTIKYGTIENIAKVLKVEINELFTNTDYEYCIRLDDFFTSPFLDLLADRYKSFYEKISFYKDVFVWEIFNYVSYKSKAPKIPYIDPDEWGNFISEADALKLYDFPFELQLKPFSQWALNDKIKFREDYKIIDAFYFMFFETNFMNVIDYLEDGIIKDKEILSYYKKWKKYKEGS